MQTDIFNIDPFIEKYHENFVIDSSKGTLFYNINWQTDKLNNVPLIQFIMD